jgi:hypothetical protein
MAKGFRPVKRPGAATRKADAEGMSVQEWATKHYHDSGRTGEQARFAKIARKWHHGGSRSRRRSRRA